MSRIQYILTSNLEITLLNWTDVQNKGKKWTFRTFYIFYSWIKSMDSRSGLHLHIYRVCPINQSSGLLWVMCVKCGNNITGSECDMTQSLDIVLKFPMYNITEVALKWTAEWADFRFYTKCTFQRGRRTPQQLRGCFPIDPSLCVIMMDCSVGFRETRAGPAVLTRLPFPSPPLVKYFSPKLMN